MALLIHLGVQVNVADHRGCTPLQEAATCAHTEASGVRAADPQVVQMLVAAGGRIALSGLRLAELLKGFVRNGSTSVLRCFALAGVDMHVKDYTGTSVVDGSVLK